MKAPVTITEIPGRAKQGMTRPFDCRGDDWLTYYVKPDQNVPVPPAL